MAKMNRIANILILLLTASLLSAQTKAPKQDKPQPDNQTFNVVSIQKPSTNPPYQGLTKVPAGTAAATASIPATTATCAAASLPDSQQPNIRDGYVEYKFFMIITPAPGSGPISGHDVDCGTFTLPVTVFNNAKTIVNFGTLQSGSLSTEMEIDWPNGDQRTFYEVGEAYSQITGPSSAVRTSGGASSSTWPPFSYHTTSGTTVHFSFNYAIPDPQHSCNPSCIVVGNSWLMGNN